MTQQFKIYKQGVTSEIVTILSKQGERFDYNAKVAKYKMLGYTVYDLDGNII